jgi:transcriptional regulator with PAS, ATPase and Fis domain
MTPPTAQTTHPENSTQDARLIGHEVIPFEARERERNAVRGEPWFSRDPRFQQTLRYIDRIAPSVASVIISGESGTGKEVLARHIHQLSGRRGPFVAVNCGAISEHLAESELFGHEAGAFTGANSRRSGWFEAANRGTLFLDEIGELPRSMQVKLLRVLQEREVVRVGSRQPISLDFRVIAATNVDLPTSMRNKEFRSDLYYRLNVCRVNLTPLRERKADVPSLAQFFLEKYSRQLNSPVPILTEGALAALDQYDWPGNIRELENSIHTALLVASNDIIDVEQLVYCHLGSSEGPRSDALPSEFGRKGLMVPPIERLRSALRELFASQQERQSYTQLKDIIIEEAYSSCRHSQKETMTLLGISRNMLRNHLGRRTTAVGSDQLG